MLKRFLQNIENHNTIAYIILIFNVATGNPNERKQIIAETTYGERDVT
jgi:hypothetical protein